MGKLSRKIHNVIHPEIGRILMLHRVLPEEQRSHLKANRELEITPQYLEDTIKTYQKRGYEFVSLDEAYFRFSQKRCRLFSKKFVCFTFDDGYIDNYEIAYPIFKKYRVPFAIYVTTDFIEKKALLWWYVLEQLGVSDTEFENYREQIFNLAPQDIVDQFKEWFPNREFSFEDIANRVTLTKEHLQELSQDSLCTIGCHTITHPRLDKLSDNNQESEIVEANAFISSLLDKQIYHFAFPYGYYNQSTLAVLSKWGFKTAVRTFGGSIRNTKECLELPRINLCQR